MATQEWNHTPADLPLGVNPLFVWPLRPLAVLRWYWDGWFPLTQNMALVGLAAAAWYLTAPTLDTAVQPGLWMLLILLRNLLLLTVLAQTLHLIFHARQLQGLEHKYDPRPFPRKGRVFTFQSQYWDNVFWSLASGGVIWSAYEVLIWWAMANGYAPTWGWADGPVWFVAVFFLIPVWESFYFYWIHRVLHWGPFYRFHALHH
ncbi:MAG: sterol desaturase family protein, partial [Pseudomonadota bacterium]